MIAKSYKLLRATLSLAVLSMCFCGGSALAVSFSSVDLDLDDPLTGANSFSTVFRVTETVSNITIDGGPEIVDYIDDNQSGMQVNLDIDFSDLNAPIVNAIEFVGEPGDISHVFVGGSIDVEFTNALFDIDLDATPNGIKGFLRTQGGPINVNPDGSFVSGNTNLVARQGTVGIQGTIDSLLGSAAVDETFNLSDTPLDQFNDSISAGSTNDVSVVFDRIEGSERVYSVAVSTVLENTLLPFSANGFDLELDITGTLLGRGEVRIDVIPEPTSIGLIATAMMMAGIARRRR
ncbi:MAG: PEP-CTERM sorting domain-containing protein [Planctomycetota bacterium]